MINLIIKMILLNAYVCYDYQNLSDAIKLQGNATSLQISGNRFNLSISESIISLNTIDVINNNFSSFQPSQLGVSLYFKANLCTFTNNTFSNLYSNSTYGPILKLDCNNISLINNTFIDIKLVNTYLISQLTNTNLTANNTLVTKSQFNQSSSIFQCSSQNHNFTFFNINITHNLFVQSSIFWYTLDSALQSFDVLSYYDNITNITVSNNIVREFSLDQRISVFLKTTTALKYDPTTLFSLSFNHYYVIDRLIFKDNDIQFHQRFQVFYIYESSLYLYNSKFSNNSFSVVQIYIMNLQTSYHFQLFNFTYEGTNFQNRSNIKQNSIQQFNQVKLLAQVSPFVPPNFPYAYCDFNYLSSKFDFPIIFFNCNDCQQVSINTGKLIMNNKTVFQFFHAEQPLIVLELYINNVYFGRPNQIDLIDLPVIQVEGGFRVVSIKKSFFFNFKFHSVNVMIFESTKILQIENQFLVMLENLYFQNITFISKSNQQNSLILIQIYLRHRIQINRLFIIGLNASTSNNSYSKINEDLNDTCSKYIKGVQPDEHLKFSNSDPNIQMPMQSPIILIQSPLAFALLKSVMVLNSSIIQAQQLFKCICIDLDIQKWIIRNLNTNYRSMNTPLSILTFQGNKLLINESIFQNLQLSIIGVFNILSCSNLKLTRSLFIDIKSMSYQSYGGILSIQSTASQTLSCLIGPLFINRISQYQKGGCFYIQQESKLQMIFNKIYVENVTSKSGSFLYFDQQIQDSSFIIFDQVQQVFITSDSIIQATNLKQLYLTNFIVQKSQGTTNIFQDAMIQLTNISYFKILRSQFYRNDLQAISVSFSSLQLESTIFISNSHIQQNGTVNVLESNIHYVQTYFFNNTGSYGGAIYYSQGLSYQSLSSQLSCCNNFATFGGGAMVFLSNQNLITSLKDSKFWNNQADIGPNVLTNPFGIKVHLSFLEKFRNISFFFNSSKVSSVMSLVENITSGTQILVSLQFLNCDLTTQQVDVSNQVQDFLNISVRWKNYGKESLLPLIVQEYEDELHYTLLESILLVNNNTNNKNLLTLDFSKIYKSFNIDNDQFYFTLKFIFNLCDPGNYMDFQSQCVQCPRETYNQQTNQTSCKQCPQGGNCTKGLIESIKQGYWRKDNQSDDIIQCQNSPDNCQGQKCQAGYVGPLCETCDFYATSQPFQYSQPKQYQCQICNDKQSYLSSLAGSFITIVATQFTLILITKTGLISIVQVEYLRYTKIFHMGISGLRQLSGIYIKIIINHLQMFLVLLHLSVNHINILDIFKNIFANFVTINSINPHCLVYEYSYLADNLPFVELVVVISLTCLLQLCLLFITYMLDKCLYKSIKLSSLYLVMVAQYLFFFPQIAKDSFQRLSCRLIQGNYLLSNYLLFPCYDFKHMVYAFGLVLPLIIFFLVFIPIYIYKSLNKQVTVNQRCITYEYTIKYGMLIQDYNTKTYYFEFFKIAVKIILALFLNLLDGYKQLEILFVIQLLIVQSVLTKYYSPFLTKSLLFYDQLSVQILISSFLLLLLTEAQTVDIPYLIYSIIALANCVFLFKLIYQIINQTVEENLPDIQKILEKYQQFVIAKRILSHPKFRSQSIKTILRWRNVRDLTFKTKAEKKGDAILLNKKQEIVNKNNSESIDHYLAFQASYEKFVQERMFLD